MTTEKSINGTWVKFATCFMGAVTLISTGWAASSTTAWMQIRRIDTQGTQKTIQLETRVIKLETTVEVTLKQMNETLNRISADLQTHLGESRGIPAK